MEAGHLQPLAQEVLLNASFSLEYGQRNRPLERNEEADVSSPPTANQIKSERKSNCDWLSISNENKAGFARVKQILFHHRLQVGAFNRQELGCERITISLFLTSR